MTTIAAARVVLADRVLEPGVVELDGNRIGAISPTTGRVPDRTVVPGFVDLQVNGFDDVHVATAVGAEWDRLGALLARGGTTTWCPTLVTAPLDRYPGALGRATQAAARSVGPAIAGVHLEGPFLGAMPGAHRADFVVPVDGAWLAALPDIVRVITLAPECLGAVDAVASLAERGVLVAIGHSAATFDETLAAVDAGARLVTHCFNAMTPLHHREPGIVGAALSDPRLTVTLIADLVHVHPAVLTVALRAKGRGRVALVTDAVAWRGAHDDLVPGGGRGGGRGTEPPRLADGTMAGSALTMAQAFANLVDHCGAGLLDAAWAASTTPAALLGLADRGTLEPGRRADLAVLDTEFGVAETWVAGTQVHG